eukprot:TRINITY_DN9622_c0_g1_i2.p2 TRINITY_DN9622_c0_g1~~TRINITY_DN9622_c0_g1_i2.p2  ORF type:complete len:243 (+),score=50.83 TRINITY_DN9622_c0_g1_i2:814-1542(+)
MLFVLLFFSFHSLKATTLNQTKKVKELPLTLENGDSGEPKQRCAVPTIGIQLVDSNGRDCGLDVDDNVEIHASHLCPRAELFNDKAIVSTDGTAIFGNLVVQIDEDEFIEEDNNFPLRFEVMGLGKTAERLPCHKKQLFAGIKFPMRLRECHITPPTNAIVPPETETEGGRNTSPPRSLVSESPPDAEGQNGESDAKQTKYFQPSQRRPRSSPPASTPTKRPVTRSRPRNAPEGTACGCLIC